MPNAGAPNPCDAVEFIDEAGQRWAWSESNTQYEPVPPDGAAFTVLRERLRLAEAEITRLTGLVMTYEPVYRHVLAVSQEHPELLGRDFWEAKT